MDIISPKFPTKCLKLLLHLPLLFLFCCLLLAIHEPHPLSLYSFVTGILAWLGWA